MNKISFITKSIIFSIIVVSGTVKFTKPWLPNTFGYSELGWVHSGHMSVAGDLTSVRKWTGWTGFQSKIPWPVDHYKVKLRAGQKIELTLSGVVNHGKVRASVFKRAGYYHNPLKVGQLSDGQSLRLQAGSAGTQTLIYEIKEDGYYEIIISTIGKLNKNYTIKSDIRYDVRWRLV